MCKIGKADLLSQVGQFFIHLFLVLNIKCTWIVLRLRVHMTKLRVASHRLEIEVGRWARPNRVPIDERKCRFRNTLEDEFHFCLNLIYIGT